MATLTLSESSPTNTTLVDPYGKFGLQVSTPCRFTKEITTIKRNGQILATVKWATFGGSELAMGGISAPLNDVFPKSSILSDLIILRMKNLSSRVFTTASGEKLKWKYKSKLECVSPDSGLPLATYNYKILGGIRNKKSTLEISPNARHLIDIIVVTWVIYEKKARDNGIAEGVSSGVEAAVSASTA
ncbi:unnamed protein product [Rhizoctonia solani]|uniref:DUF6593 domain-containing protein n=1 Tax=Rhizoctonia solani TaxID=456999 RepID=A0A8H3AX90_9AGAM|nr:unnamed protein product [Rhizoctonia solani]